MSKLPKIDVPMTNTEVLVAGMEIRAEVLRRIGANRTYDRAQRALTDIFGELIDSGALSIEGLCIIAAAGAVHPCPGFEFDEPKREPDSWAGVDVEVLRGRVRRLYLHAVASNYMDSTFIRTILDGRDGMEDLKGPLS